MDYSIFSRILLSNFDLMPKALVECLYQAFAPDEYSKVEINDFIASLAVLKDTDNSKRLRFLFRVYFTDPISGLQRIRIEKILKVAYENDLNEYDMNRQLDEIFSHSSSQRSVSQKELENYSGNTSLLEVWVIETLGVFLTPLPPRLVALDRRYSLALETERMLAQFGCPMSVGEPLKAAFYNLCMSSSTSSSSNNGELTESMWVEQLEPYVQSELARQLFRAKLGVARNYWRFVDFVDFCLVFGIGTSDKRTETIYSAFKNPEGGTMSLKQVFRMFYLLASAPSPKPRNAGHSRKDSLLHSTSTSEERPLLTMTEIPEIEPSTRELSLLLPPALLSVLVGWEEQGEVPPHARLITQLITVHSQFLSAITELQIVSCCVFGMRPSSPRQEQQLVTELMVRHSQSCPATPTCPRGPPGTEWSVVASTWLHQWRLFSSGQEKVAVSSRPSRLLTDTTPPPTEPLGIDNFSVLRRSDSEAKQLLEGVIIGREVELVSPDVFRAFLAWYGGGPKIQRFVVSQADGSGQADVELFPVFLRIFICDKDGKIRPQVYKELLYSRLATIGQICLELSKYRGVEQHKARLWDCGKESQRDHFILSPEISVEKARLQEGHPLLLEISSEGIWPRAQLLASLDAVVNTSLRTVDSSGSLANAQSPMSPSPVVAKLNQGLVGLDNLGNTCYLNSSLQALLHTDPLVKYFLEKQHLKDVNIQNKHGYGGRLAHAFGKLAVELWTSDRNYISPRSFRSELSSLRSQFRGNEQHDAQELLAFLLDGLSEDLNLVHDKPYTEQPDSDGRPDSELADIWWHNHLRRERSVVQTLFSGQFKSVMTCGCGFNSARFEAFNLLALPLPEDTPGSRVVYVVPRGTSVPIQVTVTVMRGATLKDVLAFLETSASASETAPSTVDRPVVSEADKWRRRTQWMVFVNRALAVGGLPPSSFPMGGILPVLGLVDLDRRLDSFTDAESLFFYQVDQLPHSRLAHSRTLPHSEAGDDETKAEDKAGSPPAIVMQPTEEQPQPEAATSVTAAVRPSSKAEEEAADQSLVPPGNLVKPLQVYVVLVCRRLRAVASSGQGIECFAMETFGVPVPLVLDSAVTGAQLYASAAAVLSPLLKAEIGVLSPATFMEFLRSAKTITPSTRPYYRMTVEDAVGGAVPPDGFILRMSSPSGLGCPRCPWLQRCDGCLILRDQTSVALSDGDTITADWHYVVYQELLDTTTAMNMHRPVEAQTVHKVHALPLSRCLQAMFGQDERLEGSVCPKCRSDSDMRNKLWLWRLPPVLVLQLKRFQFDRRIRRKLNNQVDFPLVGLDLRDFLAPSRRDMLHAPDDMSTLYDLYSVVHHVGAMSGGHYVTTVVDQGGEPGSGKWRVFNDDSVSVVEAADVCGPSAYLLFYRLRHPESDSSGCYSCDVSPGVGTEATKRSGTAAGLDTPTEPRRGYTEQEFDQLMAASRRAGSAAATSPPSVLSSSMNMIKRGGSDCCAS